MSILKKLSVVTAGVAFIGLSTVVEADALTLTHNYELNNSYADSLGGPSIVPNGGVLGSTGYTFDPGQGPNLSDAINSSNYSIEMDFSIDQTSGYRKLLDFKNLTSDSGLYNLSTALNFYPVVNGSSGAFTAGELAKLVVTRDSTTNVFTGYVNGVQQFSFTDTGLAVFSGQNNIIHFLRDDFATGGGESSSGFLDRIRIYDGALTAAEVASLDTTTPVPFEFSPGLGILALGACGAIDQLRRKLQKYKFSESASHN